MEGLRVIEGAFPSERHSSGSLGIRSAGRLERGANRLGMVGTLVGTFRRNTPVFASFRSHSVAVNRKTQNEKKPRITGAFFGRSERI